MSINVITAAPVLKLENGLRVANFSSPHSFHFVTGEILAACDESRCRHLSAVAIEEETVNHTLGIIDIQIRFELGEACIAEIELMEADANIDVILAPLPIVQAAKEAGIGSKLRTVRMADRVKKLAFTNKFCLG